MSLIDYLAKHSERVSPASAGRADVHFFGVNELEGATAEGLRAAIEQHKGEFCAVDPFDGREHNYLELGGWVGDQGLALRMIGLGSILGLWKLLTPSTLIPGASESLASMLAGHGWISLKAPTPRPALPKRVMVFESTQMREHAIRTLKTP